MNGIKSGAINLATGHGRGILDRASEAQLEKLGLAEKYVRLAPGNVVPREAAEALSRLKAGENPPQDVLAAPKSNDGESEKPADSPVEAKADETPPKKPYPVPGEENKFFRSTPDSLREHGLDVARQIYERRGHADADKAASEIVDAVGEEKAAKIALGKGDDGVPADVRTMVYGQLLARKAKRLADASRTPEQRAQDIRDVQELQAVKPAQFTERGQEISALQQVYKNVHAATMAEYLDGVKNDRERKLGPEGGKAVDEAAPALNDARDKGIDEATKALESALRKRPLTKSLWQSYRDSAAKRMIDLVDSRVTPPKEKAPLQDFVSRIVEEMRSRVRDLLPEKDRLAPPPSAAELLGEAMKNKDKYADVLTTVRRAFLEKYGEGSPVMEMIDTELANMGLRPYSERLLDRAIGDAHSAMRTKISDLAKQHFTKTDAKAGDLADALVKEAGLSGKEATELEADITERVKQRVADARKKALDRMRTAATQTASGRKALTHVEQAVKLNNLGAFSAEDLHTAIAKKIGLSTATPEQMQELAQMADRVETSETPAARARAELDLATKLRVFRGFSKAELATSVWYANLLSGYTTHAKNILGNVVNGTLELASTIAADPKNGGRALAGWIDGFGDGWSDAKSILKRGYGRVDFDAKTGTSSSALENVDHKRDFPNLNKKLAGALNLNAAALKYVFRAMKAADAVFYYPAKEAYTRVATAKLLEGEYKGKELDAKVRDVLHMAPRDFASAQEQATNEGMEGIDHALRTAAIIEERRQRTDVGRKAIAEGEARGLETTYNNDPVGWAGVLYHHVQEATNTVRPFGVPVGKAFLPFLRVPTNIFNASLNYTPVGALRAWRGMEVPAMKGGKMETVRKTFTQTQRARLLIQSIGGSLMMAGLYALASNDDKDRAFDITGSGPSDFNKQAQLKATGWRPHSIKIGNTWVSYTLAGPLMLPMAIVGNAVDVDRYEKAKENEPFKSKAIDAAMRGSRVIFEMSMLEGLGTLMDFVQGKSSAAKVEGFLTQLPVNAVVPFANLLRQIDRTFDPKTYNNDGPLGSLGGAVPGARHIGTTVKTDVLGQLVTSSPLDGFATSVTDDPLRKALVSKNVIISTPDRDTKIGKHAMTPEQYQAFVKLSGDNIRRRLTGRVPQILRFDPEHTEKLVQEVTREEREKAKSRVRRMPTFDVP